jgi:hypothetical protein
LPVPFHFIIWLVVAHLCIIIHTIWFTYGYINHITYGWYHFMVLYTYYVTLRFFFPSVYIYCLHLYKFLCIIKILFDIKTKNLLTPAKCGTTIWSIDVNMTTINWIVKICTSSWKMHKITTCRIMITSSSTYRVIPLYTLKKHRFPLFKVNLNLL